jgi:voltage-gated potassium channel
MGDNTDQEFSYERFKREAYIVIYGTHTFWGKMFDLVLLALILISTMLVMLETVEGFDKIHHDTLVTLEWIITVFFTLEYFVRILVIKKPKSYVLSFYGIIDLAAILPMYLSLVFSGTTIFGIVRALRLLRLFKILNHPMFSGQSLHLRTALYASRGKIVVFVYFVLIISVLVGFLMYLIEGKESGFTSIPTSIYWCIVTLTTVGYGDISPVTPLGQLLATFIMVLGYGIIAVPTGIVTAELAKGDLKSVTPSVKMCEACGAIDNNQNANYCSHCGHAF